jgi:hypothetical protein
LRSSVFQTALPIKESIMMLLKSMAGVYKYGEKRATSMWVSGKTIKH